MVFTAGLLVGGGPTFNNERMALYRRTSILGPPPLSSPPPVWQGGAEKDENSINLFFAPRPFSCLLAGEEARWVGEERGKLLFHLPSFAPSAAAAVFSHLS